MHKVELDKIKVLDLLNALMPSDNGGTFTDAEIQWRYLLSQILKELHTGNFDVSEVIDQNENEPTIKIEDGHIVDIEKAKDEPLTTT